MPLPRSLALLLRALLALALTMLALPTLALPALAGPAPTVSEPRRAPGAPGQPSISGQPRGAGSGVPDHVLARVAQTHGWSVARVEAMLAADPALRTDARGRLFYVDAGQGHAAREAEVAPRTAARTPAFSESRTFRLHSRPGARRTIFIDVDGHRVADTLWNRDSSAGLPDDFYGPLDADGAAGFSTTEHAIVQEVWQRVAEDYAPYDVDVTTEDPGAAALVRSSSTDRVFGMRALVTSDPRPAEAICGGACVGVAYLDVFGASPRTPGLLQPAWAFAAGTGHDPVQIAETVSHEIGHTLALVHDAGRDQNGRDSDYHVGTGFWSPIMGMGYGALTQFSRGEYAGASNGEGRLQDDFAVMDAAGIDFRADDHGSRFSPTTLGATTAGVIGHDRDTDWFAVEQGCAGPLSVAVRPAARGANLDAQLTVIRPDGTVHHSDPTAAPAGETWSTWFRAVGLGATWRDEVAAGRYLVGVDGIGHGDPASDGYSDYGSVGAYTVRATASCPAGVPSAELPEQVEPTRPGRTEIRRARSGARGGRDTATVRWREPESTGGAEITRYRITALKVSRSGKVLERTQAKAGPAKRAKRVRLVRGRYRFVVRAVNEVGAGRKSPRSNTVRAR